jgi:hypothetical protein
MTVSTNPLKTGLGSANVVVNIKDLPSGATGDGVADDYTAAVRFMASAAGKSGRIPAGNYRLPFTGTNALAPAANTVIEGDGKDNTTLTFVPSSDTFRNLFAPSGDGITFRNLKITCECPAGGSFTLFNAAVSNVTFENCDLDGTMTNVGAALSHSSYMCSFPASGTHTDYNFINCDIHGWRYGLLKNNVSTSVEKRLTFAHCDFYENYTGDCSINTPGGATDDVQIYACTFRDGRGVSASLVNTIHCGFASGTNFRIALCHFSGDIKESIHLEEDVRGGVITGNTFDINTANGAAIWLSDNNIFAAAMPQYITISNNVIRKSGTQKVATTYGISLANDASGVYPAKNIIISDNILVGWDRGIDTGSLIDDTCKILNNVAIDCTNGFYHTTSSVTIQGNTSKLCDVGVYAAGGVVAIDHTFEECTLNADAATNQITLIDPIFHFPRWAHAGGSTSEYKPLVPSGANDRHYGLMQITEKNSTAGDCGFQVDEITWTGAAFTATNKMVLEPGGTSVSSVQNGGNLAVQVFSTNARTVDLSVRFNGMLVVAV